MDNQTIVIQTELVEDGEYVQAFRLIPYFSDRWRYDSLSGTVIFTRKDGVTVGIKAGDSRIVIGQKIFHTSTPLLRREGRLYIPLYVVDTYLFPGIQFGEAGQTVSEPEPTVTPTPALIATPPTGNIFVYPTPTPEGGAETPEPTVPVYIFGTPTPTVPPMAAAYPTVPSGVIVLDPGNDPAHPGPAGIAGQRECDLTLAICQKLAANLSQYKNFAVVLTRNGESDAGLTVQERITIANQSGGDLFLS
ncbi:MAG: N-acetylmuramoyl-L-alanine amidase, partial [bacterium]|nr:N-acetylmuramoyl-L-alanine amidase [bacterium]